MRAEQRTGAEARVRDRLAQCDGLGIASPSDRPGRDARSRAARAPADIQLNPSVDLSSRLRTGKPHARHAREASEHSHDRLPDSGRADLLVDEGAPASNEAGGRGDEDAQGVDRARAGEAPRRVAEACPRMLRGASPTATDPPCGCRVVRRPRETVSVSELAKRLSKHGQRWLTLH
jgi:hypothetical protein